MKTRFPSLLEILIDPTTLGMKSTKWKIKLAQLTCSERAKWISPKHLMPEAGKTKIFENIVLMFMQKFLKKAFEVLNIQNYLSAINCLNFSFESGILQTQQFSLRFWIERWENKIEKKQEHFCNVHRMENRIKERIHLPRVSPYTTVLLLSSYSSNANNSEWNLFYYVLLF